MLSETPHVTACRNIRLSVNDGRECLVRQAMSRARRVFSEENKKGFPGFSEKTFPFSARGRSPRTERPKRRAIPCAAFSSMPCSFSAAQSHDASPFAARRLPRTPFPTPETDARIRQAEKPRAAASSRAMRSARRPERLSLPGNAEQNPPRREKAPRKLSTARHQSGRTGMFFASCAPADP